MGSLLGPVLKQHEEWRGNPFLLKRRRLRRSLDGRKKGGRWRVPLHTWWWTYKKIMWERMKAGSKGVCQRGKADTLRVHRGGKFSRASTKEERGKVENTQTSRLLQLTPVTLRPPLERMGARESMFGLVERCTLAASRLGCLTVRRLWSIQVVGDTSRLMEESLRTASTILMATTR